MDLVQVLPNALKCPCVSIKHALKKQGIKTLKPLISQGFQVSASILVTQDGKSTARGYNAPCFESVVHNFVGSILMRWDNEDRKDRLSIALAIQNETKHFQVVSSNFQVQY